MTAIFIRGKKNKNKQFHQHLWAFQTPVGVSQCFNTNEGKHVDLIQLLW